MTSRGIWPLALVRGGGSPLWAIGGLLAAGGVGALVVGNPAVGGAVAISPVALYAATQGVASRQNWRAPAYASRAVVAWLLLLAAALPWANKSAAAIGAVSVSSRTDLIKLVITAVATALAFTARPPGRRIPILLKLLFAYAIVALAGGVLNAELSASSVVRSGRYAAVVVATWWVVDTFSVTNLLLWTARFAAAVAALALGAYLVGLSPLYEHGRLGGYLPSLQPNELGLLAAVGLVAVTGAWTAGMRFRLFASFGGLFLTVIILTGSRTSIASAVAGLFVFALPTGRGRGPIVVFCCAFAIFATVVVQLETGHKPLTSLITRNGTTTGSATLQTRSTEWSAVRLSNSSAVRKMLGQGLAAKSVEVNVAGAQYTGNDGTWFSAYLSGGLIGLLFLAGAALSALFAALRRKEPSLIALLVCLLVASVLENVFNDVAPGLLVLVAVAGSLSVPASSAHSSAEDATTDAVGSDLARPRAATGSA